MAKTVGELVEELSKYDADMPLWIKASCREHGGRVFTQIRPYPYRLCTRIKGADGDAGKEIEQYRGISLDVDVEFHEYRSEKANGRWRHEYRDYVCISNSDVDDMELDED